MMRGIALAFLLSIVPISAWAAQGLMPFQCPSGGMLEGYKPARGWLCTSANEPGGMVVAQIGGGSGRGGVGPIMPGPLLPFQCPAGEAVNAYSVAGGWSCIPAGSSPTGNVILVGGDATSCILVGGDATSCILAN